MTTGVSTAKKQAFFNVSDADYAPMSLTMFESVRKHYPDADLFLFVVGTGTASRIEGDINVVYIRDVVDEIDLKQRIAFYLAVELACSFRPQCFEYLFAKGYERVFYVDPDLYFFRRMTEVDSLFDSGSVNCIITPHILKSISEETLTGDRTFMQCGTFNMGFFALKNSSETMRLLEWWSGKLKWQCVVDWPRGLFVDQKWMDFLPSFFDGVHVLRLPTYNLAPWNSEHFEILSDDSGKFYIGDYDTPVTFIHFSGVKRSVSHYGHMQEAYSFYLKELRKKRHVKPGFMNYSLRAKRDDIFLDRICSFLYKEYVERTKDKNSDPYSSDAFYDYLHSKDGQTGFPVYVRALFEVLPDIFRQTCDSLHLIDYDNMIQFMNWSFDYDGVATVETIVNLRNAEVPLDRRFRLVNATSGNIDLYAPNAESPYRLAALSLPLTSEQRRNDRQVIFRDDRIEIKSGKSHICMPCIGEDGGILNIDQIAAGRFTEIWVPSAACAERLREQGSKAVRVVPRPVVKPTFQLQEIDVPDDKFVVLMRHDFNAKFSDQDPVSAIRAFKRAFGDSEDVQLVCFAVNAECMGDNDALAAAASGDDRISLVKGIDGGDLYYSYLHRAQCFISLHQDSEFGYSLAEAMSIGKYVIASTVGENVSFMNQNISFLIAGSSSSARVTNAAKILRSIYDDLELVDQRKKRARQAIQKHLSPSSIGWVMQERLEELSRTSSNPLVAFYLRKKFKLIRSIEKRRRKILDRKYRQQVGAVSQIWFSRMNRPAILE